MWKNAWRVMRVRWWVNGSAGGVAAWGVRCPKMVTQNLAGPQRHRPGKWDRFGLPGTDKKMNRWGCDQAEDGIFKNWTAYPNSCMSFLTLSHLSTHLAWNSWLQGRTLRSWRDSKSHIHTTHLEVKGRVVLCKIVSQQITLRPTAPGKTERV